VKNEKTKQCKTICYEYSTDKKAKITEITNCDNFTIHRGKAKCKLFGKLNSEVTGECFYLGRKIRRRKRLAVNLKPPLKRR
jgi:hypothetical protein